MPLSTAIVAPRATGNPAEPRPARLLGAIDRNPYRSTYGCFDREFWHYRTASFPCGMHQEGVLPLALAFATAFPGNRWQGNPRVKDLAVAGLRFAAQSSHADGSCDDYYPFERALGAAVFTLSAAARACELLHVDAPDILAWLKRRAIWVAAHGESGTLTNHHALAALGLRRVGSLTGMAEFRQQAERALDRVLNWQHAEGWFEEYGGTDPGYQTVTIDCLAKIERLSHAELAADGPSGDARLGLALARAVEFARHFMHPDGTYGGEYGSRGTCVFYPHGCELLAGEHAAAGALADGFLCTLAAQTHARFDDDRMCVHRLGNLIEAFLDWSATTPAAPAPADCPTNGVRWFPGAGLCVRHGQAGGFTAVAAARGGAFKHFAPAGLPATDAGLVLETTRGRIAVSQLHELPADATFDAAANTLTVRRRLHWVRFETMTPVKQLVLHAGMRTLGRRCRTLARRLLQRRLITGRKLAPVDWRRRVEFLSASPAGDGPSLRVTDEIDLLDPRLQIRRLSLATDLQAAYVAAANVHQDSSLAPWTDLAEHVAELNSARHLTMTREY